MQSVFTEIGLFVVQDVSLPKCLVLWYSDVWSIAHALPTLSAVVAFFYGDVAFFGRQPTHGFACGLCFLCE